MRWFSSTTRNWWHLIPRRIWWSWFSLQPFSFLVLSGKKTLGMLRGGHFSISLHIATNHKTSRCCVTQFFVFAIIFLFIFYFSIAFIFCFVFLLVWVCCGHISISLHIAVPHRTSRSWVLKQFFFYIRKNIISIFWEIIRRRQEQES